MIKKDYYAWEIVYLDGRTINKQSKIDTNKIYGPCIFKLIPKVKGLEAYSINLKEDQKLISFRRIFGKLNLATDKNTIKNIIYFIGYKHGSYKNVKLIDIGNKKVTIKKGYTIKL